MLLEEVRNLIKIPIDFSLRFCYYMPMNDDNIFKPGDLIGLKDYTTLSRPGCTLLAVVLDEPNMLVNRMKVQYMGEARPEMVNPDTFVVVSRK